MRNLKRVLSLALATAMLFSMMVIGASAADRKALTDLDKVNNKEAVNLMVDLGIIVGKPDGSFAPTELVDRATMTKLITYIMMGDVDPVSFEGTTTDLKDIDSNWAKGYIKYCYANGIVAGNGAGSFMPGAKVTAVSAAKMLLVGLGYDAEAQGYVNTSNWSVNIMRDAQKAGLLNNLSVKATEELSRDKAAQMVYNTLFANTVTNIPQWDNGNKYITITEKNVTTLGLETYGLVKLTGTVDRITGNGKINYTGTVTRTPNNVTGAVAAIADGDISMVGKSISTYYSVSYGISGNTVTVSATNKAYTTTSVANNVLYTDNKGNSVGDLISDKVIALDPTVNYVQNGSAPEAGFVTTTAGANKGTISKTSAVSYAPMTAWTEPVRGSIVNYIDSDGNGKVDMVVQDLWSFGQVANKSTKANAESLTLRVGGSTVLVSKDDILSGFDAVAKDDFVNIQAMTGGTYKVALAEEITGTLTAYKTSAGAPASATISGTVYTVSRLSRASAVLGGGQYAPVIGSSDAKFYLDVNGFVVASDTIDTVKNYVAILQAAQSGSGMLGDTTYTILAVDAEGVTHTYTLAKSPADLSFGTAFTNLNTAPSVPTTAYLASLSFNSDGKVNGISNLTEADSGSVALNKNEANTFTSGGTTYYMSAKTQFIFAKLNAAGTKVISSVYTGLKNIPNGTYANAAYIADVNNEVKAVLVYDSATATVAADYLYLNSTSYDSYVSNGTTYRTYNFVLNGESKPITILDSVATSVISARGTYKFSTDKDGITTLTPASNTAAQAVTMVDPSFIVAGGSVVYLNKDAKISDITGSVAAEGTLAKGQFVTYVTEYNAVNGRDEAVAIFIIDEVDAEAPTVVSIEAATARGLTVTGPNQSLIGKAGAATGHDATHDAVKITVTAAVDTTVTAKLDGATLTLTAGVADNTTVTVGTHILSVTATDDTTLKTTTYTYVFTVAAA